jgi:hypothetical protein
VVAFLVKETPMPLHYTKIFAIFALLTIGAFVLWLTVSSVWQGESEAKIEAPQAGAALPDSK